VNPCASLAFRVAAPGSVGRAVINSLCPLSAECLRAGGDRRVCVCDRSVYVRVAVWRYVRAVCMYVLCRRMYVYVTDREGQPQGRCLSRVSCVRRSAVLGADPACLSSPHIRHSIIYSERAAPRKGRSVRSQSPEGTENYRSYKTGAATLFTLVLLTSGARVGVQHLFSILHEWSPRRRHTDMLARAMRRSEWRRPGPCAAWPSCVFDPTVEALMPPGI
jgi:hypothetical protein